MRHLETIVKDTSGYLTFFILESATLFSKKS